MKSMVIKFQTRLFKVLAFLLVMAITFPLLNEVNVNAAKKPGQVKISEVKETDSKIVVKFKKISKAKGYQIQWSSNDSFSNANSAYLKKNNKSTMSYKTEQVDPGTYYVRVRAYKLNKSKKVYGKWSSAKKITVNALSLDIITDDAVLYGNHNYELYTGTDKTFSVAGKQYNEGFRMWNEQSNALVLINLHGMYDSITFDVGRIDGTRESSDTLHVYKDGEFYENLDLNGSIGHTQYTIDVKGTNALALEIDNGGTWNGREYGFYNIKYKSTDNATNHDKVKTTGTQISDKILYDGNKYALYANYSDKKFYCAGNAYFTGFTMENEQSESTVFMNLDMNYTTMSLDIGKVNGWLYRDCVVHIYRDGTFYKDLVIDAYNTNQHFELDVEDTSTLKFSIDGSVYGRGTVLGFFNISFK